MALISNTICGLQTQLDILYRIVEQLGLVVNLDKSNIVIFRNGGIIARAERWVFGQETISVVNMYKYLGIFLSTRLSFKHSLESMAQRAKKGVVGILKVLWTLGDRSPSIFFKLFDCQIAPMLTYGAEVWGLSADLLVLERVPSPLSFRIPAWATGFGPVASGGVR